MYINNTYSIFIPHISAFFQNKEKRPRFGPLRKAQDSSSDKSTPVKWLKGTTNHQDSVRFAGGSGEPVKDIRKVLVRIFVLKKNL